MNFLLDLVTLIGSSLRRSILDWDISSQSMDSNILVASGKFERLEAKLVSIKAIWEPILDKLENFSKNITPSSNKSKSKKTTRRNQVDETDANTIVSGKYIDGDEFRSFPYQLFISIYNLNRSSYHLYPTSQLRHHSEIPL